MVRKSSAVGLLGGFVSSARSVALLAGVLVPANLPARNAAAATLRRALIATCHCCRMSGPLSCEYGACPYPVAAWAHPTSANMTNSAASGLCRFICFDLFPPNTSAYSARAISSIRLRSLLRTFPTRAHRPACHLGRRVGCERGLEAGRVRRLLSESCGPPFELQDRRHAVVDLGAQLVRRCRDDRKAAHPFIGRDRISPEAARDYHALSASAIAISDLPAPRIVRGAMTNCTASASTSTRSPGMQTRRANCAPTSTPHMPR